ncbi:MAG: hypothetical protein KBC73_17865 [Burkholderiaceae bacterium]|nr:hypothetical protein [Burkholderiaceae bacterium]
MLAGLLAGLSAACAPALDWRELRPPGWGIAASLPCRPATQQRSVELAGAPVALALWACDADGHVFALASADLADPARVAPALQALGEAARLNLAARVDGDAPAQVPGMTPQAAARLWRLSGRRPDGQPLREQVLVFAHGTRVFQVTLIGPRADDALARPLFDALRVLP